MKISVKVKTRARVKKVEQQDAVHFIVAVPEVPEGGKANRAVISALAEYFRIAKRRIGIIAGEKSTQKIIEILDR